MSSGKRCIVSVGSGNWYPKGINRLKRSLIYHGFDGTTFLWKELPPNCPKHSEIPYAFKIYAIQEAIEMGYETILWLDCSAWCIANPEPLFDHIQQHGYYLSTSGYNCSQTCNDAILDNFGLTRDEALNIPDSASGAVGLFLSSPIAKQFFLDWMQSMERGDFNGSRNHDLQSHDSRFMFHRQDQSAASLIAHGLGMDLTPPNILTGYYQKEMPESMVFCYRGM